MAETKKNPSKDQKNQHQKHSKTKFVVAAIFILIVISALYYGVSHFEGISSYGDDPTYVNLAAQVVSQHNFKESQGYIFSIRLVEIYAISAFYYAFGPSNFTSTLWNLTSYIGLITVAFLTVRLLYDDKAALITAFLVSI